MITEKTFEKLFVMHGVDPDMIERVRLELMDPMTDTCVDWEDPAVQELAAEIYVEWCRWLDTLPF